MSGVNNYFDSLTGFLFGRITPSMPYSRKEFPMEAELIDDDYPHKWQYTRALTPERFTRIIKNLGMTMAGAGRYLGVSERTIYRYSTGDAPIPVAIVLLLKVLLELGIQPCVPTRNGVSGYRKGVRQLHPKSKYPVPPTPSG